MVGIKLFFAFNSAFCFLPFFWGRNPRCMKLSEFNPEIDTPEVTADDPAIGINCLLIFLASEIKIDPGSFIPGVPASDTSAIFEVESSFKIFGNLDVWLYL